MSDLKELLCTLIGLQTITMLALGFIIPSLLFKIERLTKIQERIYDKRRTRAAQQGKVFSLQQVGVKETHEGDALLRKG